MLIKAVTFVLFLIFIYVQGVTLVHALVLRPHFLIFLNQTNYLESMAIMKCNYFTKYYVLISSMLNYLTSLGSHLHQIYVLETTLQYTLREYNKIQDQIKFEPPESPIREKMVNAAKKMLSNIDCIKRASARVRIVLEKVREYFYCRILFYLSLESDCQ